MPTDKIIPMIGDAAMLRDIEMRLADTGVNVLDAEAVWLYPDADVRSYLPAFETASRLGAAHILVVGNDPDESRVIDNFGRFCVSARPFGLTAMLEFIPYCHTRTVEDAYHVVSAAAQPNSGVLVDALHLSRSGGRPNTWRSSIRRGCPIVRSAMHEPSGQATLDCRQRRGPIVSTPPSRLCRSPIFWMPCLWASPLASKRRAPNTRIFPLSSGAACAAWPVEDSSTPMRSARAGAVCELQTGIVHEERSSRHRHGR